MLPSLLAACGEDITELAGTITSPNYPSDYENLMHCTWNIQVPEGKVCVCVYDLVVGWDNV